MPSFHLSNKDIAISLVDDPLDIGDLLSEVGACFGQRRTAFHLADIMEGLTPAGRRFIKQIAAAMDEEEA